MNGLIKHERPDYTWEEMIKLKVGTRVPESGEAYPCAVCRKPIVSCELCEACAITNDPFPVDEYQSDMNRSGI